MTKAATGNGNRAEIVFVAGMTGTGKTQWLLHRIAKRRRLMVWSPKEQIDNYAGRFGGALVHTRAGIIEAVHAAGKGPFCVVVKPTLDRKIDEKLFSKFCSVAMLARNVCVVVDELHTVTRPSWAPPGWSQLCLMGRGFGTSVYGLSQRPASVDKDFFGNCSMLHCGRLGFMPDAKVMGELLGVPPADLLSLPDMHYLNREPRTMQPAKKGITKWRG